MMKSINNCGLTLLLCSLLSLTSCVKDTLYNTPHPTEGAVKITTDWSARSSESVLPADYTLRISGTEEQQVQEATNIFHSLLAPGAYDLLMYNSPSGFTVSGNTATVAPLADGTLNPLPGYLFSASQTLSVQQDDTLRTTVKMQQRIRQLTLVLKLKAGDEDRYISISATLTGIASAVNLSTGALSATGTDVKPIFELLPQVESDNLPRLGATLRMLGIVSGEQQKLNVKVTMQDESVHLIETNLTDVLKSFGSSVEPLVLDASLKLPTEAETSGSIVDWEQGTVEGSGDVSAE